jgi:hypothetical protein
MSPRGSRKLGRPHSFSENNKRTHQKALTSRDVWINLGLADDQIQLKLWDGIYLRNQSGFFSWQTEFFSNETLEQSFNPSRDELKLTSEFSHEVGPFPFRTQQHGEVMSDCTLRSNQISARGTTHRSPRRPYTDHDSTRLPHPLAGFCL